MSSDITSPVFKGESAGSFERFANQIRPPPAKGAPRELADCPVCSALWEAFVYYLPNRFRVKFGQEIKFDVKNWDTPASQQCSAHAPMLRVYRDLILPMRLGRQLAKKERAGKVVLETIINTTREAAITSRDPWEIYPGSATDVDRTRPALSATFELIHRPEIENHPGTATILDKWIDLETVRQWKETCATHHKRTCWDQKKITTRPAWLVDVQEKCLVRGEDVTDPFVALSYVRGKADEATPNLKIDKVTLHTKLQKSGSLDKSFISSRLSPTIRHAMHVTATMGERYLWVDTLCIIHDSSSRGRVEIAKELERMGRIYASATFTIVVAQGNSQDGIPGLKKRSLLKRRFSNPREMPQTIIPFGPNERIVWRDLEGTDPCRHRPYCERGWTFQEQYLSPRKLIFASDRAHWQCPHTTKHEGSTVAEDAASSSEEYDSSIPHRISILRDDGYPDLESLEAIINPYNSTRVFRYQEDALPGILGLLSVLSKGAFRGFIYGIPITMFDAVLNWTPQTTKTTTTTAAAESENVPQLFDLCRRKPSNRPTEERLHPSALPSWSWIGWKGRVSLGGRHCLGPRDGGGPRFIDETVTITEWWAGENPSPAPDDSVPPFKIESTAWHKALAKRKGRQRTAGKSPSQITRRFIPRRFKQIRRPYMWPPPRSGDDDNNDEDGEGEGYEDAEYVFTYGKDFGGMEEWPFDLPWDKSDVLDAPAPPIPQLSFLFCKTRKAVLTVSRRLLHWEAWGGPRSQKVNQRPTNTVALARPQQKSNKSIDHDDHDGDDDEADRNDAMIGALHLHTAEEASKLSQFSSCSSSASAHKNNNNNKGRRAKVELVAINKTRRYSEPVDEVGGVIKNQPAIMTSRVGVLWIEWDLQSGVASRKASGWVYEDEWERLGPQDVDLVLG